MKTDIYFGDIISDAMNCGYDFSVTDDMQITLTPTNKKDKLPEITVETISQNGVYCFNVSAEFPKLSNSEFHDDIEHWIYWWSNVGNLCTLIQDKVIRLEDYEGDTE